MDISYRSNSKLYSTTALTTSLSHKLEAILYYYKKQNNDSCNNYLSNHDLPKINSSNQNYSNNASIPIVYIFETRGESFENNDYNEDFKVVSIQLEDNLALHPFPSHEDIEGLQSGIVSREEKISLIINYLQKNGIKTAFTGKLPNLGNYFNMNNKINDIEGNRYDLHPINKKFSIYAVDNGVKIINCGNLPNTNKNSLYLN